MEEDTIKQKASLAKLETMKGFKSIKASIVQKSPQTTPAMKQLLLKQMTKKTLLIEEESLQGTVRLEPFLTCDANRMQVEFKIGVTHKYVLKDVFSFYNAMEGGSNVYYGQKLQFVHTLEAFDMESRPFVEFICNWVRSNKN